MTPPKSCALSAPRQLGSPRRLSCPGDVTAAGCWPTSAAYGAIAACWGAPGCLASSRRRPHRGYPLVLAKLPRTGEASGRVAGWGWREQAEGAGAVDRLGAAVRAELGEEVTYMRPDRMH
jgi:hypothetical protein